MLRYACTVKLLINAAAVFLEHGPRLWRLLATQHLLDHSLASSPLSLLMFRVYINFTLLCTISYLSSYFTHDIQTAS